MIRSSLELARLLAIALPFDVNSSVIRSRSASTDT